VNPLRLHVLYEYGQDRRPFGSASIRLLRPLSHPVFRDKLAVTSGQIYHDTPVDAVIVDRLWRPDISLAVAQQFRAQVSRAGARLLYALDDNFPLLAQEPKDWKPTIDQLQALEFFLAESDGILVTTPFLQEALSPYNSHIAVVPNMLDDRLLDGRGIGSDIYAPSWKQRASKLWSAMLSAGRAWRRSRTTIGYMGTFTHDDDLLMVLPALREIWQRHGDAVVFEVLGVAAHTQTHRLLQDLPVRIVRIKPRQVEYSRFVRWFSRIVNWDIAISPLCDTHFNQCKSDIKFLDYSAIGAAGIFSRVPAYMDTVRHGETGWLVENTSQAWVEALDTLIRDSMLRKRIAAAATRYLYTERIVQRAAGRWLAALEQLMG
jgi:processive 1,2-diacylglycerol beta-glucosyltransferase